MKKYFSLVTFSHSIFAFPFAVIGFFLAITTTHYPFNPIKLLLMALCMLFARNAAMAFNRFIDRKFDAQNPRTQNRDIPSGNISEKEALLFTLGNVILFCVATFFINHICFALAPVALFVVLGYSVTKRFTALCHIVLGIGLALAPIGAYLVVTGTFAYLPILYSFTVLFWVSGFDIIYALQDDEFDKSQNLYSIPVLIGRKKALQLSRILHLLSFMCVLSTVFFFPFTWIYNLGILFFGAMLLWQHRLVKEDDLSRVDRAFFTTNGIASVIFALFFLLDVWMRT